MDSPQLFLVLVLAMTLGSSFAKPDVISHLLTTDEYLLNIQ